MADAAVFKTEILGRIWGFESPCGHQIVTFKEFNMATSREQIKMIDAELQSIREQIARLKAQEEVLLKLQRGMTGVEETKRKRAPSVKPLVLDIMSKLGAAGGTSQAVDTFVRMENPQVAKDTVGSVLSRLKADGALVYDGERYYEKRHAPPSESRLRII